MRVWMPARQRVTTMMTGSTMDSWFWMITRPRASLVRSSACSIFQGHTSLVKAQQAATTMFMTSRAVQGKSAMAWS